MAIHIIHSLPNTHFTVSDTPITLLRQIVKHAVGADGIVDFWAKRITMMYMSCLARRTVVARVVVVAARVFIVPARYVVVTGVFVVVRAAVVVRAVLVGLFLVFIDILQRQNT